MKHLFAYTILIAGLALLIIAFLFYMNNQAFDPDFLYALGGIALMASLAGIILVRRLS